MTVKKVLTVYNSITTMTFPTEISMWVVLKEMRPADNYISVARAIRSIGREKKNAWIKFLSTGIIYVCRLFLQKY